MMLKSKGNDKFYQFFFLHVLVTTLKYNHINTSSMEDCCPFFITKYMYFKCSINSQCSVSFCSSMINSQKLIKHQRQLWLSSVLPMGSLSEPWFIWSMCLGKLIICKMGSSFGVI